MRQLARPQMHLDARARKSRGGGWRDWDSGASATRHFKKAFVTWALQNQQNSCAFCCLEIDHDGVRRTPTAEHIAPKEGYPQWTFESLNLIMACGSCNSHFKHVYDPVVGHSDDYEDIVLTIVHPYLDKVSDHIRGGYLGGLLAPVTPEPLSIKGLETISLFNLIDPGLRKQWDYCYIQARKEEAERFLSNIYLDRFNKIGDELGL
jgi:hypothetical protein